MRLIFIILLSVLATAAAAQDFALGDLKVTDPVARETTELARVGAGYLSISNLGETQDALIAVEADFPRVMIHNTVMDGDVAKMEHLMSVPIGPGETIAFVPGGMHVMFMGLDGDPLEAGESFPAVLVFQNAGRLDVNFTVRSMDEIENHTDK